MNVYFSGIGGVGIGPLAEIAADAGYTVFGSDQNRSLTTEELEKRSISIAYDQSGEHLLAQHEEYGVDWFVHTAALPEDHPELSKARQLGIRISKRDEFLAHIIEDKQLKLIAVSGTHGKTTTTGMLIWALTQLGVPISYSVGSTLSFGPAGVFRPGSEYFIYECDEFDHNFLYFSPYLALLTSVDYDHPDTYPTKQEYFDAFSQFISQSSHMIAWEKDVERLRFDAERSWVLPSNEIAPLRIAGEHNRANATIALKACEYLGLTDATRTKEVLEQFPGTGRRFERLADNLYSDYGHHPVEIAATLQLARELSDHVVLVYQPHQNTRQHEIKDQYTDCMDLAEKIYWLPTYLTREDPNLPILTPVELTEHLDAAGVVHISELDETLWTAVQTDLDEGKLVLFMGAGTIDDWVRRRLTK